MKISTLAYLGLASTATCEITCGLSSGYDRGEKAYFFSGDGSLANFDACSARCQSDSKCQSFAFDSSQCLLYSSPLDSNFRQQSNSPFLFYDRNCVDVKATSSFTTTLPSTTAEAAGGAATPPPASGATTTAGSGGSGGGGNGGGNGGSGGDSTESGSAPTAQAVSTTDGTHTALPGSGGAPGGQLGASNTASSGFSTATATGTGASAGSSATKTSSSGSGSGSSTASSSSSGSSSSGTTTSSAAATAAESFRMVVLGSLCVLAVFI